MILYPFTRPQEPLKHVHARYHYSNIIAYIRGVSLAPRTGTNNHEYASGEAECGDDIHLGKLHY